MLPSILRVQIERGVGRGFRLWLPLFVVWIIVLACIILILPLLLLAQVILLLAGTGIDLFRIFAGLFHLVGALKGVQVNVDSPRKNSKFLIAIN